jgi:hypothetical protein
MDFVSILITIIPTGAGIITALVAISAYKDGQKLRRKETMFTLREELDKSENMKDARLILDSRIIRLNKKWKKPIVEYGIIWDEIEGDCQALKNLLIQELGLNWTTYQGFIKNEEGTVIIIHDKDSFLSIILDERLPYCVKEDVLDRMVMIQNTKSDYKSVHYLCANVLDGKMNSLSTYYHKSNLKYILRIVDTDPIIDEGEDQIRRSFDSLLDFYTKVGYLDEKTTLISSTKTQSFRHCRKVDK